MKQNLFLCFCYDFCTIVYINAINYLFLRPMMVNWRRGLAMRSVGR